MGDFKAFDEDGDGLASRAELVGYAKEIASALFKSKNTYPYLKDWADDKNDALNSSEWRYKDGPWPLEDSKLSVVRQMLLAQHKFADADKDMYVTFEELRAGGWTYEENSTEELN